jgi:hypothetical protein
MSKQESSESTVSPEALEAKQAAFDAKIESGEIDNPLFKSIDKEQEKFDETIVEEPESPEAVETTETKPEDVIEEKDLEEAKKAGIPDDHLLTDEEIKALRSKDKPEDPWAKRYTDLQSGFTKVAQENAEVKKQLQALNEAIKNLSTKPVDLKEIAKDPAKLKAYIDEQTRAAQEGPVKEWSEKLNNERREATIREITYRQKDAENYPRWNELYPTIQKLGVPVKVDQQTGMVFFDPKVNHIKFDEMPVKQILDELYKVAEIEVPVGTAPKTEAPKPAAKTYTEADIEKAKQDAYEKAQKAEKAEKNGQGVTGMVRSGKRQPTVIDYSKMSKDELRDHLIKQQEG